MPPMLFIFGCGRSGTTLLVNLFERDLRTRVYREFSELSSLDTEKNLRLDPLPMVEATIRKNAAPFVILKPLVESQNAPELLEYFPTSKAIWVYRHYLDVAASNLNKFGVNNGVIDLAPIAEYQSDNWRSERASPAVSAVVKRHYTPDMDPYEAAALFWFARNRLYFELGLDQDPRVMIVKYEDLIGEPSVQMQRIYDFAGQAFPGDHLTRTVHRSSLGKGSQLQLSEEVNTLCRTLLAQLDGVNEVQSSPRIQS